MIQFRGMLFSEPLFLVFNFQSGTERALADSDTSAIFFCSRTNQFICSSITTKPIVILATKFQCLTFQYLQDFLYLITTTGNLIQSPIHTGFVVHARFYPRGPSTTRPTTYQVARDCISHAEKQILFERRYLYWTSILNSLLIILGVQS